jgi:hypothetical protein
MSDYEVGKDIQALRDLVRGLTERMERLEKHCSCRKADVIPMTGNLDEKGDSLSFKWDVETAGDCTLRNGVLTVFANGTATFSASVSSKSPSFFGGDYSRYWFVLYDVNNKPLVNFPRIDSPNMVYANDLKVWRDNFGGGHFPDLKSRFASPRQY